MRPKCLQSEIRNYICVALTLTAFLFLAPAFAVAGVSVVEKNDYVFGNYAGSFSPSPPHADANPKHAFTVSWSDNPYKLVFCHEQSYCPFFELPSGAGMCYQFWEGNGGWAELFNNYGRMEINSSVQVVSQSSASAHLRWTYYGVNMHSGERGFHATEDFYAFSNGLVLRKQAYVSLDPKEDTDGDEYYAREPIEMIGMCPVGKLWSDVLSIKPGTEERHALAVLDAFSTKRYDVYWTPEPTPDEIWYSTHRREGCAWRDLNKSSGVAMAVPFSDGSAFCILGDASGFQHDDTNIKEHTYGSGGANPWGSASWDHWPIGWLNSQTNVVDETSLQTYPNHFSPAGLDLFSLSDQEAASGTYYSLIGVGNVDLEAIRSLANTWLGMGAEAVDPASVAGLPAVYVPIAEPSSAAIFGIGVACVLCAAGRRCRAWRMISQHCERLR